MESRGRSSGSDAQSDCGDRDVEMERTWSARYNAADNVLCNTLVTLRAEDTSLRTIDGLASDHITQNGNL